MGKEENSTPTDVPDATPARPASTVGFVEIPRLTALTDFLNRPFDVDNLDPEQVKKLFPGEGIDVPDVVSGGIVDPLFKLIVRHLLTEAAQGEFPGTLVIPSELRPGPDNQENPFEFVPDSGRLKLQRTLRGIGGHRPLAVIDMLAEVDGIPVVIDTRATKVNSELQRRLEPTRLADIGMALDKYYPGKGFGYIYVVPNGSVDQQAGHQNKLRAAGGAIVPLGATANDIISSAQRLATARRNPTLGK